MGCSGNVSDIGTIDDITSIVSETEDHEHDNNSPTVVLVSIFVVVAIIFSFIIGYLKHAQQELNFWNPFRKERDDGRS